MKRFPYLIALVVIAFTLSLAVSCDIEEAVKDEVTKDIDTSFEDDEKLELDPIISEKTAETATLDGECGTTSVIKELEKAEVDTSDVDIDSITLEFMEAKYTDAHWTPEDLGQVTCTMMLYGDIGEAMVTETAVKGSSSAWTEIELDQNAEDFINHYLANRSDEFDYCVQCTDADSHYVVWKVRLNVLVAGNVHTGG